MADTESGKVKAVVEAGRAFRRRAGQRADLAVLLPGRCWLGCVLINSLCPLHAGKPASERTRPEVSLVPSADIWPVPPSDTRNASCWLLGVRVDQMFGSRLHRTRLREWGPVMARVRADLATLARRCAGD